MTITQEASNAINTCKSCAEMCRECAKYCENKVGMEACASLCEASAVSCDQHCNMLSQGDHSGADKCIAACEASAVECGRYVDDDVCARAADASRKCAVACKSAEPVKA